MEIGYGFGFSIFGVMFVLVWILVIGTFVVVAIKGISQWNKNNNSPRLTVIARVVGKRQNFSRHRHNGAGNHTYHTTSTTYYVTFQVESGDRIELLVSGDEYGMLIEGDNGKLSFQGTRYLGFERM